MVKQYIQRAAPMHMFVSKFNEFVMHRNLQEGRERHWTKTVSENVGYSLLINLHTSIYEDFYFFLSFFFILLFAGQQEVKGWCPY